MGDRANIKLVEDGEAPIYLYSHWFGTDLPEILRQALIVARPRWGDESYCNRILIGEVFSDLFAEKSETGGGVSTYVTDGSDRVIEVRHSTQTIGREGEPDLYSFKEYVSLDSVSWSDLGEEY